MGDNCRLTAAISHALVALALRQHGNVTRSQLCALGLNDHAIACRARSGQLHRVYPGVYGVGRPPFTPLERAAAAALACGEHGALSHRSALALWGLDRHWQTPFEVTLVRGDRRPRGITVHRAKLQRRDVTVQLGIRVTTPARTLLDCAPALTAKALARAVTDAGHAHILFTDDVAQILARYPNHPGARKLAQAAHGPHVRSDWEYDFVAFCARHGLPEPQMNAIVCGLEVDAYFPQARVIVELDSWQFHRDRRAFENDRERDARTSASGHLTVRITHERLGNAPATEAQRLHQIIAARAQPGDQRPQPGDQRPQADRAAQRRQGDSGRS